MRWVSDKKSFTEPAIADGITLHFRFENLAGSIAIQRLPFFEINVEMRLLGGALSQEPQDVFSTVACS